MKLPKFDSNINFTSDLSSKKPKFFKNFGEKSLNPVFSKNKIFSSKGEKIAFIFTTVLLGVISLGMAHATYFASKKLTKQSKANSKIDSATDMLKPDAKKSDKAKHKAKGNEKIEKEKEQPKEKPQEKSREAVKVEEVEGKEAKVKEKEEQIAKKPRIEIEKLPLEERPLAYAKEAISLSRKSVLLDVDHEVLKEINKGEPRASTSHYLVLFLDKNGKMLGYGSSYTRIYDSEGRPIEGSNTTRCTYEEELKNKIKNHPDVVHVVLETSMYHPENVSFHSYQVMPRNEETLKLGENLKNVFQLYRYGAEAIATRDGLLRKGFKSHPFGRERVDWERVLAETDKYSDEMILAEGKKVQLEESKKSKKEAESKPIFQDSKDSSTQQKEAPEPLKSVEPVPEKEAPVFNPIGPFTPDQKGLGNKSTESMKGKSANFYLNQQARLLDLREKAINETDPSKKHSLLKQIFNIENSDIERINAFIREQKFGKKVEEKDIALHLGKTLTSTRGIILGKAYAKIIQRNSANSIRFLSAIDQGWNEEEKVLLERLKGIEKPDLSKIAQAWGFTHEKSADLLNSLHAKAYKINPVLGEAYRTHIDKQVAEELKINPGTINLWLEKIILEQKINSFLTLYGEETEKPLEMVQFHSEALLFEQFLAKLEENIADFDRPLHLIKLQNILNKLRQNPNIPAQEMQEVEQKIEKMMDNISKNMQLAHQSSTMQLLNVWEGMASAQKASQAFLRDVGVMGDKLNKEKGILEAKTSFLLEEIEKPIAAVDRSLKVLEEKGTLEPAELEALFKDLPHAMQEVFIEKHYNNEEMKNAFIEAYSDELSKIIENYNEKQSDPSKKLTIDPKRFQKQKKYLKEKSYFLIADKKGLNFGLAIGAHYDKHSFTMIVPFILSNVQPSDAMKIAKKMDEEEFIQLSLGCLPPVKSSKDTLKEDLLLIKSKLENVQKRQQERLKNLASGNPVIIPEYFHATSEVLASSIAKTGIEASQARSGFGAFLSKDPELRYGTTILGLSQIVSFSSKAETFAKDRKAPTRVNDTIWSGLRELIEVQPGTVQLKEKFLTNLQILIREKLKENPYLTEEEKNRLEAQLTISLANELILRENKKESGSLSLFYREAYHKFLPMGSPKGITNEEQFLKWINNSLTNSLSELKIEPLKMPNFDTKFAEDFKNKFRLEAQLSDSFSIPAPPAQKIKAVVIAPDDDLINLYNRYHNISKVGGSSSFTPLNLVKSFFKTFEMENLVEFIPLSEMLIERDLMAPLGQNYPAQWDELKPL